MKKILLILSLCFYTSVQQCSDQELVVECLQNCAQLSVDQAKEKIVVCMQDIAGDEHPLVQLELLL